MDGFGFGMGHLEHMSSFLALGTFLDTKRRFGRHHVFMRLALGHCHLHCALKTAYHQRPLSSLYWSGACHWLVYFSSTRFIRTHDKDTRFACIHHQQAFLPSSHHFDTLKATPHFDKTRYPFRLISPVQGHVSTAEA